MAKAKKDNKQKKAQKKENKGQQKQQSTKGSDKILTFAEADYKCLSKLVGAE